MPSVNGLQDLRDLQNMRHSYNSHNLHFLPFVAKFALFAPFVFFALTLLFPIFAHAQSINISNFYYRDYLDFGQNKGIFKDGAKQNGAFMLMGKDGSTLTIPRIPTFQASSNYGSLSSVGRGFAVTANHVTSPTDSSQGALRKWGLTQYDIAQQSVGGEDSEVNGTSKQYGYDEKFLRFTKYIVEGQVGMLDFDNSNKKDSSTKTTQDKNIENFTTKLNGLETNSDGNVYIYQAGSGGVTLRGTSNEQKFDTSENGEMKGGGFGYFRKDGIQYGCYYDSSCENIGMFFYYFPNIEKDFNNRITGGDSGSGIYAYDKTNSKWVLVGVVSKEWEGQNRAFISAVSQKDFRDYQKNFEQEIKIVKNNGLSLERTQGGPVQLKGNDTAGIFQNNKDIIFRGSGEINIEVKTDIIRNQSGYAGGFVFEASDSTNPTTYKFTNQNGKIYSFNGSGLDIGENVNVEWHLKNYKNEKNNEVDSLHKVGKGTLTIKTANTETTNLGTLKIGEGKVVLDTDKKAFDNIYITSGRGELALTKDKAEALGAIKNSTTIRGDSPSVNSYTLLQSKNSEMGFYFGTGGQIRLRR